MLQTAVSERKAHSAPRSSLSLGTLRTEGRVWEAGFPAQELECVFPGTHGLLIVPPLSIPIPLSLCSLVIYNQTLLFLVNVFDACVELKDKGIWYTGCSSQPLLQLPYFLL